MRVEGDQVGVWGDLLGVRGQATSQGMGANSG